MAGGRWGRHRRAVRSGVMDRPLVVRNPFTRPPVNGCRGSGSTLARTRGVSGAKRSWPAPPEDVDEADGRKRNQPFPGGGMTMKPWRRSPRERERRGRLRGGASRLMPLIAFLTLGAGPALAAGNVIRGNTLGRDASYANPLADGFENVSWAAMPAFARPVPPPVTVSGTWTTGLTHSVGAGSDRLLVFVGLLAGSLPNGRRVSGVRLLELALASCRWWHEDYSHEI